MSNKDVIVIQDVPQYVVQIQGDTVDEIVTTQREYNVIEVGLTGPQGPQGAAGDISGAVITINDVESDSSGNVQISIEGYTYSTSADGFLHFSPIPEVVPLSVTLNGGSDNEVGSTVNSVNLTWSYNEGDADPDTSQTLNQGIGAITPLTERSYTFSTPISADTTFTITAVDSTRGTDSDSTSVTFNQYKVYWGTFAPDSNLSESDIESLSNDSLETARDLTLANFAGGGNRIVYAYPVSFGLATVRDGNGFIFQDWYNAGVGQTTPYQVSVTNAFGVTTDYYVYQTFNQYFGTPTFEWS